MFYDSGWAWKFINLTTQVDILARVQFLGTPKQFHKCDTGKTWEWYDTVVCRECWCMHHWHGQLIDHISHIWKTLPSQCIFETFQQSQTNTGNMLMESRGVPSRTTVLVAVSMHAFRLARMWWWGDPKISRNWSTSLFRTSSTNDGFTCFGWVFILIPNLDV